MKKPILIIALGLLCISTISYSQDIPARVMALEQANETFKKELAVLKNLLNTLAQENEILKEEAIPIGTIQAYAGDKIPTGWKLCDGSELNQSEYPLLFNAIGKAWGGSSTRFKLPDLQGRFLRGVAGNSNADPDKADRTALYAGGNRGNQVGSYQEDATSLPNEQFAGNTSNSGEHTHPIPASHITPTGKVDWKLDDTTATGEKRDYATGSAGNHSHTVNITSGGDSETRPANAYVYFIIKADH